MKRYIVSEYPSGTIRGRYDTIGEALGSATHVIDEGKDVHITDSQGSGRVTVTHFDLKEAEGYAGRTLDSEHFFHPLALDEVLQKIKATRPTKHKYFHDLGE